MAALHSRNMYLFMIIIIKSYVLSDNAFPVAGYSVSPAHLSPTSPHTLSQSRPINGKLVHA